MSETPTPQRTASNKDQAGTQNRVLTITHPNPSESHENDSGNSKRYIPQWLKDVGEIIAVIVGIGLLIVTICQSRSTEKAASAARDSVILARTSTHIDEQAWIAIWPTEIFDKQSIKIKLHLRNTGKTFAKRLVLNRRFAFTDKGVTPTDSDWLEEMHTSPQLVSPTDTWTNTDSIVVSAPQSGLLKNETKVIYIKGLVTFDDVFGISHWLKFCFHSEQGGWPTCEGNDVDSNR